MGSTSGTRVLVLTWAVIPFAGLCVVGLARGNSALVAVGGVPWLGWMAWAMAGVWHSLCDVVGPAVLRDVFGAVDRLRYGVRRVR